ncbi:MAG: nuclease [Candidatus Woesearchaeota archaeon]
MRRRIKKWNDGDSGIFTNGTKFRLANVRAPERNQRGASTSTRQVAGMTGRTNGFVNWNPQARDRYGREVGEMSNKDGSVNQRMIYRGNKNKGR